jgi:hypothetical protein
MLQLLLSCTARHRRLRSVDADTQESATPLSPIIGRPRALTIGGINFLH